MSPSELRELRNDESTLDDLQEVRVKKKGT